ncbi:3002_t:CDS:2, partial [Funneliformis caledonium]
MCASVKIFRQIRVEIWKTEIFGILQLKVDRLTGKVTNYYLIENDSIESYTCSSMIDVRDEN